MSDKNKKTFPRGNDGDFFAVFKDENLWYRVGTFHLKELFLEELESEPYHVYKAKFKTREQAEIVCEML